ncbi:hypothetical protein TNCV_3585691 [Trichonephila clavipes]|nr:hypothetical protein TNCV_3585691 [Trichonephila clavipes]
MRQITEIFERSMFEPQQKRMRMANHEDLETALLAWLKQARSQNVPVSGEPRAAAVEPKVHTPLLSWTPSLPQLRAYFTSIFLRIDSSGYDSNRFKNRYFSQRITIPTRDSLTGCSPTEDVKAAHPQTHTTALSTGIKANQPRLRDGCSDQRVVSKLGRYRKLYDEFLSKEMPDIKIDDNRLFEVERRL